MVAAALVLYRWHHGSNSRGIISAAASSSSQQQHHSDSRGITAVAMASCMAALAVDGHISIEMGVGYHNNGTAATKVDGMQQQQ